MKKILIICLFMLSLFICSCNKSKSETQKVNIITPYGTPYIAIGGLLNSSDLNITAVNGADNLQTALVSGSHDIVIAPINLGAKFYNANKSSYQIAAVITLNNTYIVTKEENKLDSIQDLKDEKILAFGKTGIPGSVLGKVYNENELDVNNIDYTYASSSAVYSVFSKGTTTSKYALISEPEISKLVINDNLKIKTLDLSQYLNTTVVQACIFVNPQSGKEEKIEEVLELISDNINSLNENVVAYVEKIISLDRTFAATNKEVLIRSIPLSNITYKKANDYKKEINNILNILGVESPNEDFYY